MDLSPKAQKAKAAAAARHNMWRHSLKRTKTKLVVLRARRCNNYERYNLATTMRRLGWAFFSKGGYYYADLSLENFDAVTAEFKVSGRIMLNVSSGVWDWLEDQEAD